MSYLPLPAGTGPLPYAGSSVPNGWLTCDGTAVSRTTYAALFAAISTLYGTGDGSTTFNLPDIRQRFPLGKAASGTGSSLASTGGTIDHTHTVPALSVPALSVPGLSVPGLSVPSLSLAGLAYEFEVSGTTSDESNGHTHDYSGTTSNDGGDNDFANITSGAVEAFAKGDHVHTYSGTSSGVSAGHTHTWDSGVVNNTTAGGSTGTGTTGTGTTGTGTTSGGSTGTGTTGTGTTGTASTGTGSTGTGTSGSTNPPWISVNYMIKT